MTLTSKGLLALLLLAFSSPASIAADSYSEAFAAHKRGDYATALRLLRPLADHGDAASQHALGNMYLSGSGVPKNDSEAVKWLRLAADQGFPSSQYMLGLLYGLGRGVPRNYVLAHMWSSLALASAKRIGPGFVDTATKAAEHLRDVEKLMTAAQIAEAKKLARSHENSRQAARIGEQQTAQAELPADRPVASEPDADAVIARRRRAVAAEKRGDHAAALRILRSLADQGDAFSQHALANIYIGGKNVPKDEAEGVKWLRLSAEQGYPDSQFILGLFYVTGRVVPQDYVLAHMWLGLASANRVSSTFKATAEQAAKMRRDIEKIMSPSQIAEAEKLARTRETSRHPGRANNQKTVQAERAAGSYADSYGDAEAAYNRGDYATALRFFRLMAAQGDAASQHAMGNMYFLGKGVPQNDAEAVRWFRLAAGQGVPDSQFLLGMFHIDGRGVAKDYVLAHMWLSSAVASGNRLGGHFKGAATKAANELRDVEKLMTPSQIAEAKELARSRESSQPRGPKVVDAEPPADPIVSFGNFSIRWASKSRSYVLRMEPNSGDGAVWIQCFTADSAYSVNVMPLTDDSLKGPQIITVWSDRSKPVDLKFGVYENAFAVVMDSTAAPEWSINSTRDFVEILGAATKFFAYSMTGRTTTFDVTHMPAAKTRFAELCKRPRF